MWEGKRMGFLSNKIARDEVKPGDHIYSWRQAYVYAHHGITISLSLSLQMRRMYYMLDDPIETVAASIVD